MPRQKNPVKNKIGYTPGPWRAHLNVPTAIIEGHLIKADDEAACPIASLWIGGGTIGKPRQVANAHLIAAAPELLEAAEGLLDWLKQIYPGVALFHDPAQQAFQIRDLGRVIAKAKGRQL